MQSSKFQHASGQIVGPGRCRPCRAALRPSTGSQPFDLVLSSGFLAFANHSGFLQAVEEAGLQVGGVMGTSAGALAGSLYCAGYSPRQVAAELSRDPPISLLRPSLTPWRGGILSLERVVERLQQLLPPRFEDLGRDFAVGVVTADGQYQLIDSGPLAEAVVASAAIPFMFQSVDVPGQQGRNPCKDGGVVDRVGLAAWRARRRRQAAAGSGLPHHVPPALVHVISRSSPFSGTDDVSAAHEPQVMVVHSPKSGVNFLSLGDFEHQMGLSVRRARPVMAEAARRLAGSQAASPPLQQQQGAAAGVGVASGFRSGSDQRSPERQQQYARTRV
ncbi:acyl transferase/acyl hydrolase/lysophospholipase [Haematococcus lacustris]